MGTPASPQRHGQRSQRPPLQRYAEVRAVAEATHVKLISLQALALRAVPEALVQYASHLRLFRQLPFEAPPPGLLASHHGWLSRQHGAMAELLASSGVDLATLPVRRCAVLRCAVFHPPPPGSLVLLWVCCRLRP